MKIYLTLLIFAFQLICLDLRAQQYSQTQPRQSLNLDGRVNFIDAGSNDRNITNAFTLEAWVKTGGTHLQYVIGKETANAGYRLVIDNGKAEVSVTAASRFVTSGQSFIK